MIKEPLVYIILVNYNGVEHTLECIESLQKINYKNFKIIVVDNASFDDCCNIVSKKYKDVYCIQSSENLGFAAGNNIGIKVALKEKADYILLLNNDTTVEKNFLNILVDEQFKSTEVGVTISKIKNYYNRNIIWYAGGDIDLFKANTIIYGLREEDKGQFNTKKEVGFASGCCMLINREVIENVGYLDESYFLYYEDTDYSVRIRKGGYKMIYCPESVIYHKESVSTERFSENYQYYFVRNRLLFTKNNMSLKSKLTGYCMFILWFIKMISTKKFNINPCLEGLGDFIRKVYGKRRN
ncbi:MAG: glycosyltransferase family 2 protein [Clostridium sp.]|nr:glycosyltransferase family 2 protein [Clostridium sp.]